MPSDSEGSSSGEDTGRFKVKSAVVQVGRENGLTSLVGELV